MKIFADKDFLPVLKRFALMGTVALFAACGDDTSSVKPVDDDPGSEISSSSEEPSSSSEDVARSSSSSLNDASSSSAKSSSSEQSSSSSKGDALSSGAESSSSSETDVSSSSVTLKEFPLESYTKDSFKNPDIEYQTMTDERDGHVYRIVTIGTGDSVMTWMAENLNFSENTTDSALSINLKSQTSCPFGKAESCGILGRLYTWTAAMNISEGYKDSIPSAKKIVPIRNHQGVCPAGWHVPTMDEYLSLYHRVEEKLGLSKQGLALKSKAGWDDSLSADNDIFGLSFVPGYASEWGEFMGYAWLADVDYARSNSTTRIVFETNVNYTFFNGGLAEWDAYVRCVKNKDVASGKFKDSRDGKYYKYAYIGNTRWMAENLNYGNDSLGKCFWDDDENCSEYGRFYTYEEARTVCPDGWRLPTENDFSELVENVGGSENAAVYLRSTEWGGDLPGINAYGFSAKPTGLFRWGKTTDSFGRVEPQLGFSSGSFHMWLSSVNGLLMVTILDWSNSSYSVMGALSLNIDGVNESPLIPVRCVQ
jgi:CCR4-NOT transcriptional regulation complex, NOT5 subunit